MSGRALATSPLARLLLDLLERKADGSVDVGGRRLVLRGGEVVDVRGTAEDDELGTFLLHSGRIAEAELRSARADVEATGATLEDALVRVGKVSTAALSDSRRKLWLGRLASGIGADEREGRLPPFVPGASPSHAPHVALLPLMLDALARVASVGDAEAVGSRSDHRVEALEAPHVDRAFRWAELAAHRGGATIADILARDPAAAPRIAALARAGFLRLLPPRTSTPPPPPPRPTSLAPATTHGATPSLSTPSMLRSVISLLPPPRAADLVLDPGAAPLPDLPEDLATPLRTFPPVATPLGDPIDPVETEIARLEQSGAAGAERAAAWKQAARQWQTRYGSVEEAARCFREAAAADPSDRGALEQAAMLCAALGDASLAQAYGRAAAALAPAGEAREEALLRLALWADRAGDAGGATLALRSAAAEENASVTVLEQLVVRLVRAGDRDEAVEVSRLAAARAAEREPLRARTLVADALALRPEDPGLARQLAASLASDGLGDAAALVLAETARGTLDPESARQLRLEAAEQAEESGRPDIAAELLLEAFDNEPELDVLHEAVVLDLERARATADLAVVCEDIALACEDPETKADWLVRAAVAHGDLPGGAEAAIDALVRAAELAPDLPSVAAALRAQVSAGRERDLVADAHERIARAALSAGANSAPQWLLALAELDEDRLDGTRRTLWAWEHLHRLDPNDAAARDRATELRAKVRMLDTLLEQSERELAAVAGAARLALVRKTAAMLREHPDRRIDAAALFGEIVTAVPDDAAAMASLERVTWLIGDLEKLAQTLTHRAEHTASRPERARHLTRLAAVHAARGATRAAAEACMSLLSVAPQHREGAARLQRAASRLGDLPLLERAYLVRAELAADPRAHGRALVGLARVLSASGDFHGAVARAEEALAHDPHAAGAAALLVGHADALAVRRAPQLLDMARALLGDSPALLDALRRASLAAGDAPRAAEALDAWLRIAPTSPQPALARLALRVSGDDPRAIVTAAANVLAPEAVAPETSAALLDAVARLEALGARADAVALGLRGLDRLGATEDTLRDRVLAIAETCGDRSLRAAAIERWAGASKGQARLAPLAALAALHRDAGDDAAEARTHLRTLAVSLYDPPALSRLAEIYGDHGEGERLLAVLGLRLESSSDAEARRATLLDLAAASAQVLGDTARAESFLDELLRESNGDSVWTLRALGALVAVGRPLAAVERMLQLAQAASPDEAAALCERAVAVAEQEAHDDALALRAAAHGLELVPSHAPLLVLFERLAIQLRDVAMGRRIYARLVDAAMGPNGRRALLYRAARFYESCGDRTAALDAFVDAFNHAPTSGVIFQAIERLAESTGNFDPLVHALAGLADRAQHVDARVALLIRAAEVLGTRMNAPKRAFEGLRHAWETSSSRENEARVRTMLRHLAVDSPSDARAGADALIAGMRKRIEKAWDAEERAVWFARAATIEAQDLGDFGRADALLEDAARADIEAKSDPDARLSYLCDRAEALRAMPGRLDESVACVMEAAEAVPEEERVRALADVLGITLPDAPSRPSLIGNEQSFAELAEDPAEAGEEIGHGTETETEAATATAPATEAAAETSTADETVQDAVADSDPDAVAVADSAAAPDPDPDPVSVSAPPPVAASDSAPAPVALSDSAPDPVQPPIPVSVQAPDLVPHPIPVSDQAPDPVPHPISVSDQAPDPVQPPIPVSDQASDAVEAPYPAAAPDPDDAPTMMISVASLSSRPPTRGASSQPPALGLSSPPPSPYAAATPPPSSRDTVPDPGPLAATAAVERVLDAGDLDGAESLAALLARDPARAHEAAHLLRTLLRRDPSRTGALRALHAVAVSRGARAEARVAESLLSLFDRSIQAPSAISLEGAIDYDMLSAERHDTGYAAMRSLLRRVWENGAQLLFRRSLQAYRTLGTDRISARAQTPIARAYAAATRLLDASGTPLYVRQWGGGELIVATTSPPSIIAGPAFEGAEPELRFRLARALELARPDNVLLGGLAAPEARTVVEATVAAFGPAESSGGVSRDAAAFAAELWRTMPAAQQRAVRDELRALPVPLTYAAAHDGVQGAAARAGLLVAGDVRAAVYALRADDDALAALDVSTEGGFVAAVRSSASLAALVRFALSDVFLVAVTRAGT